MTTSRAALFAITLAALACSPGQGSGGDRPAGIPADPPLMRGQVTRVDPGRVRVEENPAEQTGSMKAELDVTARTAVVSREGSPATLPRGQTVSVWTDGPVMESYPVRGTAATIVVEAEP